MAHHTGIRGWHHLRVVGWSIPVLLLTIPLIARFPWSLSDYIFMALLFGIAGMLVEMGVKFSGGSIAYRIGVAVAVVTGFLLVWVNGAVGFLGNEDNPANLMFGGVILIAALGALLARCQPAGLVRALLVTAAAQIAAGVIGFAAGWASPGTDGLYEVVMGTSVFTALWILSAALFRKAQQERDR